MVGTNAEALMPNERLTDELIESMREKIGIHLRIEHSTWNDRATIAVARFLDGSVTPTPLWRSNEHARRSSYCAPVAPPSFVLGWFSGLQFGWPGTGSFHGSTDMRFHRPVFTTPSTTATPLQTR
jgi:acyl dehydratase